MLKHAAKRILLSFLVLLGVIMITFAITRLLPSDPALKWAGPKATPEQIEAARIELGLDRPIYVQFWNYLTDLVHGDLGTSYVSRVSVTLELEKAIPATLELVFYAILLSIVFGIWMGIYSAKHKNKLIDHLVRLFSMGSVSIPSFALALVLQLLFFSKLKWLPMGGRLSTTMMMDQFLMKRLTAPLHFSEVAWSLCPHGHPIAGTGLYVQAKDMVKLAWLYQNGGVYEGRRILSEEWVNQVIDRQYELAPLREGSQWIGKAGMNGQMICFSAQKRIAVAWHSYEPNQGDKLFIDYLHEISE